NLYTSVHLRDLLFLHTHTSGHDKKIFINEKSKTINDNVLRLRQEREENPATSGAKKRNMYGAGSKRVDYIIDSGNETQTAAISKANDSCFNITLSDCDSDSENGDGGNAHQGPDTSHSGAVRREEDDHDSRMIVSS
ncbi:hypothetical protein Tco_1422657, partial [Tanacetum coccineum]